MPQGDTDDEQELRWAELARSAQTGDKKRYAQLLSELIPYIHGVLTPKLADTEWASDISQEILLSIHKSLHTYSPDRPFKPWLNAIINFRKTDFLRQYYKRQDNQKISTDDYVFVNSYVTDPAGVGEFKDIQKALENLSEDQRQVFVLLKIKGFSVREVAQKLEMSESAVKVSAHRTQKKLKELRDKGL